MDGWMEREREGFVNGWSENERDWLMDGERKRGIGRWSFLGQIALTVYSSSSDDTVAKYSNEVLCLTMPTFQYDAIQLAERRAQLHCI